VGIITVVLYTAIVTFILLKVVDQIIGLRVPQEVEIEGLDTNLHGEKAYGEK
jgi:Amt family ammonium transporter